MQVSKWQLFYLSMLSMLGFIATDMYLPAFTLMEASFSTGPELIAFSLTVFLIGMGSGQIMWGVASDRYGHKKTLVCGLALFTLASLGLVFSTEVWQLLSLRFIQAIGVCAPSVIWQAMVIKRYSVKSQQIFSTIMPLVALSPALAPLLGAGLQGYFGWRSIFVALVALGVVLVYVTAFQPKDPIAAPSTSVLKDISSVIKSKVYLGNVMIYAFGSAAFFGYLTGVPVLMGQLGYEAKSIALSFIPQTIAFIVGGWFGKKNVMRYGDSVILPRLLVIFSLAAVLIFIISQMTIDSIFPMLIPFCVIAAVNGGLYPIVVNRALLDASHAPASAAGLQNSVQIGICGIASALVASFASVAQAAIGLVLICCVFFLWAGFWLAGGRSRKTIKER